MPRARSLAFILCRIMTLGADAVALSKRNDIKNSRKYAYDPKLSSHPTSTVSLLPKYQGAF